MPITPRVSLITSCSLATHPLSQDEYNFYEVFLTFYLQLSMRGQKGKVWTRWTCDFSQSPLMFASKSWGKASDVNFLSFLWGKGYIEQQTFLSAPTISPVVGELPTFAQARANSSNHPSGINCMRYECIDMSLFPSHISGRSILEWTKTSQDWKQQPTVGLCAYFLSKCYLDQHQLVSHYTHSMSSTSLSSLSCTSTSSLGSIDQTVYMLAIFPSLVVQAVGLQISDKAQVSVTADVILLHSVFPYARQQFEHTLEVHQPNDLKLDVWLEPLQAVLLTLCIVPLLPALKLGSSAYLDVLDASLQLQRVDQGGTGYTMCVSSQLVLLHLCVGSLLVHNKNIQNTPVNGLTTLNQVISMFPMQVHTNHAVTPQQQPICLSKRPGQPKGPIDDQIRRLELYFEYFFITHPANVLCLFRVPKSDIERIQNLRLPVVHSPSTGAISSSVSSPVSHRIRPVNNASKVTHTAEHEQPAPVYLQLQVLGMLGSGSFGCVYIAQAGDNKVALKVQTKTARQYHGVERRIQSLLNHPLVPKQYGAWESTTHSFLAIEYAAGGSLLQALQVYPRGLPYNQALYYLNKVTELQAYLHSQDIIWGDLKMENLLLRRDGSLLAADYGLAFHTSWLKYDVLEQDCGTSTYMAPELQISRHGGSALLPYLGDIDANLKNSTDAYARDIWALGVLACELFSGVGMIPHTDDSVTPMVNFVKQPRFPPLPSQVLEFVQACCILHPHSRPRAAEQLFHPVFADAEKIAQNTTSHIVSTSSITHGECREQLELPVSYMWNCYCDAKALYCGCFLFCQSPPTSMQRSGYTPYSPSFQSGPSASPMCRGQFSPSFASLQGAMDNDTCRTPKVPRLSSPFSTSRVTETPFASSGHRFSLEVTSTSTPSLTPASASRVLSDYGRPLLDETLSDEETAAMDDVEDGLTPLLIGQTLANSENVLSRKRSFRNVLNTTNMHVNTHTYSDTDDQEDSNIIDLPSTTSTIGVDPSNKEDTNSNNPNK